jgi:uncharacterized membrane protein
MTRRLCLVAAALLLSPTLAVGQTSLTELGAANAVRNEVISNGGQAAAGAAPAAAAPAAVATPAQPGSAMKYTLSYALAGMFVGLGMYIICRPSQRHEGD